MIRHTAIPNEPGACTIDKPGATDAVKPVILASSHTVIVTKHFMASRERRKWWSSQLGWRVWLLPEALDRKGEWIWEFGSAADCLVALEAFERTMDVAEESRQKKASMPRHTTIPAEDGFYWLFDEGNHPEVIEVANGEIWLTGCEAGFDLSPVGYLVGPIPPPVPLVDFEVPVDLSGPVGAVSK